MNAISSTMSVSDNDSDVSEDGISMKIDSKGSKDCNDLPDATAEGAKAQLSTATNSIMYNLSGSLVRRMSELL